MISLINRAQSLGLASSVVHAVAEKHGAEMLDGLCQLREIGLSPDAVHGVWAKYGAEGVKALLRLEGRELLATETSEKE